LVGCYSSFSNINSNISLQQSLSVAFFTAAITIKRSRLFCSKVFTQLWLTISKSSAPNLTMAMPSTNIALLITGMVILLVVLGIGAALRINWCVSDPVFLFLLTSGDLRKLTFKSQAWQILVARRARREARATRRAAQSSASGGGDANTTVAATIV
jgi:hypothetical protein